jgi:hypothetical protein
MIEIIGGASFLNALLQNTYLIFLSVFLWTICPADFLRAMTIWCCARTPNTNDLLEKPVTIAELNRGGGFGFAGKYRLVYCAFSVAGLTVVSFFRCN